MLHGLDETVYVPPRSTVQRRVVFDKKENELALKRALKAISGRVSLTMKPWSSRIYKGYTWITLHLFGNT